MSVLIAIVMRALLVGVYVRAADCWKLPRSIQYNPYTQQFAYLPGPPSIRAPGLRRPYRCTSDTTS